MREHWQTDTTATTSPTSTTYTIVAQIYDPNEDDSNYWLWLNPAKIGVIFAYNSVAPLQLVALYFYLFIVLDYPVFALHIVVGVEI